MAGPSTTGTLGLDIEDFTKKWTEVRAEIPKIEKELKAANAQLKTMERVYRGASTGASVTSKQIERQKRIVKDLTAELKASKSELVAFGDELGKPRKNEKGSLQKLLTAGAILSFARNLSTAGRQGGEFSKSLDDIGKAVPIDELNKGNSTLRGTKNLLLDLVGAVEGIPVIGDAVTFAGNVGSRGAANRAKEIRSLDIEMNKAAASSGELLSQLSAIDGIQRKLQERADKESITGGVNSETAAALVSADSKRVEIGNKIADAIGEEAKSRSASLAGSQRQANLAGIELDRLQKIASLQNNAKDAFGNTSEAAQKAVEAGTKAINDEAERGVEIENKRYQTLISEANVQSELATSALRGLNGQAIAARRLAELAQTNYDLAKGTGEEAEAQAKAQRDIAEDQSKRAQEAALDEITALRVQTMQMEAQAKGMESVATQSAIRLNYETQITAQMRAGNTEAVKQLETQKQLALAKAQADEFDKTPRERRIERRNARIQQSKAKNLLKREQAVRNNRGGGGLSSGSLGRVDRDGNPISGLTTSNFDGGATGIAIREQSAKDMAAEAAKAERQAVAKDVAKIRDTVVKG